MKIFCLWESSAEAKKVLLGKSFTARMHGVPGEPKQRAGYLNHCKNVLIGKESRCVFAKVTLAHLSFMTHSPYTHLIHWLFRGSTIPRVEQQNLYSPMTRQQQCIKMSEEYFKTERRLMLICGHVSTDRLLGGSTSRRHKPAEKAVRSDLFTNSILQPKEMRSVPCINTQPEPMHTHSRVWVTGKDWNYRGLTRYPPGEDYTGIILEQHFENKI